MTKKQFRAALQELNVLKDKKLKDNKDELVDYGKGFSSNRESTLMRHIMSLRVNFYSQGIIYVLLVAFILYSSHTPKYSIGE